MFHTASERRSGGLRQPASVTARSAVLVLALWLLMPALAALAGQAVQFRAAAAPVLRAGGPDNFGYTFKDSNEPGGPVYAWDEIAATGTLAAGWNSYDNGFAGPIPIGFSFSFYGISYTQLYVGSNGYVSFGSGFGSIPASSPLPHPSDPNNMIALFGGDMYLHNYGQDSAVRYQTLGNPTRLVVQFDRLYRCCSAYDAYTFQVVVYPNGDIEARYKQLDYANPYAVGIENANGADGLNYGTALANSLAIRYSYPTGVLLAPPEQNSFGKRGAVVGYTVRLTNRTGSPDSFELAVQPDSDWPTTLSISQTGVLADGESIFFDASVAIPAAVAVGDVGQSMVEATSTASPALRSTAVLSTTAISDEIAYVVSRYGSLTLIDTTLRRVLDVINLSAAGCQSPERAAITSDGARVYVSCPGSNSVAVFDAINRSVIANLTGITGPHSIAFTRDGSYALVSSFWSNQITAINTQTYTFSAIATLWPTSVIVAHPYLDRAYAIRYNAGSGDDAILIIDTTTLTVMDTIDLPGGAWGLTISTDGRYVYASVPSQRGIAVVDVFHNTLHDVAQGVGSVFGITVASAPKAIYGQQEYAVAVIDEVTLQEITSISLYDPMPPTATCKGLEVWVGQYYGSHVSIIDTSANQVVGEVVVPSWDLRDVAICPQPVQRGVFAVPAEQSSAGALGHTVTYEFTVVNATGAVDSFTLSPGTSNWPATLSTNTVGPLAPNETATVQVNITIPAGAAWYDSDSVDVMIRGVSDPNLTAAVQLTTTADAPAAIDISPLALNSVQLVGQTVDQTLSISNGNGVTLTVEISDVDLTPGMVRLAPLDLPRAADVFTATAARPTALQPGAVAPAAPAYVPRVLAAGHEPSLEIQSGYVYTTTVDNEDNALSGGPDGDIDTYVCSYYNIAPIEFNVFVEHVPASMGNVLTVRAYNVDSTWNNHQVRFNGVLLGNLAGGYEWSETSFRVPSGVAVPGRNLVQIDIAASRCIQVDWGELFVASRSAGWLHQSPSSAVVASNSSQDVIVTFDSSGLQPGAYEALIAFESNDPAQPYLAVPVTMTVEPTADMGSVAGAISDAWTGQPLTATVELVGVHTLTPRAAYQLWATAGDYELVVSASGYVTFTTPVVITAGGAAVLDVALEPAQARLEWLPLAVGASVAPGGTVQQTLLISNTGPVALDMTLFEVDLAFTESPPTRENLVGRRILFDRSHGQPAGSTYSVLINDLVAAGAVVVENTTFPIDASVLEGYDVLWSNCCGSISWGFSELLAVDHWMRRGGSVLVHGANYPSTASLATVRDVFFTTDYCYGWPATIAAHPITAGVSSIYFDYGACPLSAPASFTGVVYDTDDRPSVVAEEANGGKMVVVGAAALDDWSISRADNRLFGNNILAWLARPSYSDVPWLAVSPGSGVVPGHSSLPVTVTFDATGLSTGVYHARLAMEHNDPNQIFPAEAPVTLVVEVPTAITLNDLATAGQPASAPFNALPVAALPAAAIAALALAAWRSRQR